MVKYIERKGTNKLKELMNDILKKEKIPKEWKIDIMLPKDRRECISYRGIILSSVPGKIFVRVVEKRVRNKIDTTLEDTQYRFRKNRNTNDLIFMIRQIS